MASKFNSKFFLGATMAAIAGCSALGGLEKLVAGTAATGTPTTTPVPTATPTARPGDLLAQASPTPEPPTETPKPSTPVPTPFPCEAEDGTKPTLRGEIITLPNGAGKGAVHYTACWGRYQVEKSPHQPEHNREVRTDVYDPMVTDGRGSAGIMAYGMVDDQQYLLVRHSPNWTHGPQQPEYKDAMFHRTAVKGSQLVYELVKTSPLDEEKDMTIIGSRHIPLPTYLGFLRHLPGAPLSIAGDVAGVTFGEGGYDKIALTPNAEARWGAGEVAFACVPLDGELTQQEQVGLALRKTSVGSRYVLHMRNVHVYGKTLYRDYGAWILAKDGRWFRSKIMGPPVSYKAAGGGFDLPVWDRQLDGFVTKMRRATGFIPAHDSPDGSYRIDDYYIKEELNASFRIVTEDEIAATMEENGCRATD